MTKRAKGFTLIELLIVVAIIGIIAAIAIPNLLNAIQRGKQKRTMSDQRSIGTAVESYQVDNGYVPKNKGKVSTALDPILDPTFIRNMPASDAWKFDITYNVAADDYSIISYGKDGSADGTLVLGATTAFNRDIYFANGQFTIYPEGTQQ
jgi:general secretion pathway protein G